VKTRKKLTILVAGVAAALVAASIGLASIPDGNGVIHGCFSKSGGAVRVIDAGNTTCKDGETSLNWNQQGVAGAPGAQGPAGPAGAAGPIGPVGPMGAKGDTGAAGPIGPAGPAGATCAKGDTGAAGLAGPVGPVGPAGAAGAKGDKGDTGATGAPGPVGPAGAVGPKGDTGLVGPPGPGGLTGPAGPKGDTGAAGPSDAYYYHQDPSVDISYLPGQFDLTTVNSITVPAGSYVVTGASNFVTTQNAPAYIACHLMGFHYGQPVAGTFSQEATLILNKSVGIDFGHLTLNDAFTVPSTTVVALKCAGPASAMQSWITAIKVGTLSAA